MQAPCVLVFSLVSFFLGASLALRFPLKCSTHRKSGEIPHRRGPLRRIGFVTEAYYGSTIESELSWEPIFLGDQINLGDEFPAANALDAGFALTSGLGVILLPNIVLEAECFELVDAALGSSSEKTIPAAEEGRYGAGAPRVRVRLFGRRPKGEIPARGMVCVNPLPSSVEQLVDDILIRIMSAVDLNFPTMAQNLFGMRSIADLACSGALEYSQREPALNIYWAGGEFLSHKDHQRLTILVPLSEPEKDFTGSGTSFSADGEPSVVVRPSAGTALLFGGNLTHAGIPVKTGTRVVLVASFSEPGGTRRKGLPEELNVAAGS